MGFQDPGAAKHLGLTPAWHAPGKAVTMRQQIRSNSTVSNGSVGPQFQWGLLHEANCRMLLISTRAWLKLPGFDRVTSVQLLEQGFRKL
jgi:hypothetical protein